MEPTVVRQPRRAARAKDLDRAAAHKARWNQYSCAELSAAMDLPLRQLDGKPDYGTLSHHMDLPPRRLTREA